MRRQTDRRLYAPDEREPRGAGAGAGGRNGAAFFAVCRGKVSEGIDFADKVRIMIVMIVMMMTRRGGRTGARGAGARGDRRRCERFYFLGGGEFVSQRNTVMNQSC